MEKINNIEITDLRKITDYLFANNHGYYIYNKDTQPNMNCWVFAAQEKYYTTNDLLDITNILNILNENI